MSMRPLLHSVSASVSLSAALLHLGWASPARPADPLAGTPYRALSLVGKGGMGEVFEAEHVALGKRVVVKVLHPHVAGRADWVDRMRLEGQALARLGHPNVVEVFDIGVTPAGRPFLVMERLFGRTLAAELAARGALPAHEAVSIACQALAGLSAAHEVGLVHRDVKLDNIFLCDAAGAAAPRVKLIDFGITKVVGGGRAPAPLEVGTDEGVALGTPRFFAPEQVAGEPVDARTDVYAMGVVLYALFTGRVPFCELTELADLFYAHQWLVPPPPSSLVPACAAFDALVLKAMEKRPEARFQSARAFAEALWAALARPAPRAPRWPSTEPMTPITPASLPRVRG